MTLHVRHRTATFAAIVAFQVRHPRQIGDLFRWVRDLRSSTMALRKPWWPYRAEAALATELPPRASVFEYGGGGSTLWLRDLGHSVTSVEHDRDWYEQLRSALGDRDVLLREPQPDGSIPSEAEPGHYFDDYVNSISECPEGSLDFVIVDGRARVACAVAALTRIRPGGMLLLDDSDRDRYQTLMPELTSWTRRDFAGLKPGGGPPCQTSVWTRPGSADSNRSGS